MVDYYFYYYFLQLVISLQQVATNHVENNNS
jgi:hypothetical protein